MNEPLKTNDMFYMVISPCPKCKATSVTFKPCLMERLDPTGTLVYWSRMVCQCGYEHPLPDGYWLIRYV